MEIVIEYLCVNESEWRELRFTPEDYFEPKDEDEMPFKVDDVHKYYLNPWKYTATPTSSLTFLDVFVSDEKGEYRQKYTFWNNGKNYLCERIKRYYETKAEQREILIHSTEFMLEIGRERIDFLILRREVNHFWVPISHTADYAPPGWGTEYSTMFDTNGFDFNNTPGTSPLEV
jgi:hypothetical protein